MHWVIDFFSSRGTALTFFHMGAFKESICDFMETFLMNGAAFEVEHIHSVENISNAWQGEEQKNSEKSTKIFTYFPTKDVHQCF